MEPIRSYPFIIEFIPHRVAYHTCMAHMLVAFFADFFPPLLSTITAVAKKLKFSKNWNSWADRTSYSHDIDYSPLQKDELKFYREIIALDGNVKLVQ